MAAGLRCVRIPVMCLVYSKAGRGCALTLDQTSVQAVLAVRVPDSSSLPPLAPTVPARSSCRAPHPHTHSPGRAETGYVAPPQNLIRPSGPAPYSWFSENINFPQIDHLVDLSPEAAFRTVLSPQGKTGRGQQPSREGLRNERSLCLRKAYPSEQPEPSWMDRWMNG